MSGEVRFTREEAIARVTLSHPGRLNAMSRSMWIALREGFLALQADPTCRCILIAGEGEAFCAGGDISEYPDFRFDEGALRHFHEVEVWGGLSAILDCDVPVVAAIRGACMGAGVEIASCCDLRLAAEDARFGAPIARLGFPMAEREARLVARAAGDLTAREMLLAARVFSAADLQARGFLSEVLPAGELAAQALVLARRIAGLAPQAARQNKRLLRGEPGTYAWADSAEHREGIAAFLAKRPPNF